MTKSKCCELYVRMERAVYEFEDALIALRGVDDLPFNCDLFLIDAQAALAKAYKEHSNA